MNPKQKAQFIQLQLIGLGIIVCGFGFFRGNIPIACVGGFIMIYSFIRLVLLSKLLQNTEIDQDDLDELKRDRD